jgi:hypothetical protein
MPTKIPKISKKKDSISTVVHEKEARTRKKSNLVPIGSPHKVLERQNSKSKIKTTGSPSKQQSSVYTYRDKNAAPSSRARDDSLQELK